MQILDSEFYSKLKNMFLQLQNNENFIHFLRIYVAEFQKSPKPNFYDFENLIHFLAFFRIRKISESVI